MFRVIAFLLILMPTAVFSDERLLGIWEDEEEDIRLDILDGFKANRGAILVIENGAQTSIGKWETETTATTIKVGWRSAEVSFITPSSFDWNGRTFNKLEDIVELEVAPLKQDETSFVNKLTQNVWLTSNNGEWSQFKSTFGTDSGVVETFDSDGQLKALRPWGIASGTLKIGQTLIIEARVSTNYLVGIDERDKFLVFLATATTSSHSRADLANERADFLARLVTDVWRKVSYDGYHDYRFRPIEGPLAGRRVHLQDDKLEDMTTWEYSPSTGALKIGHTKYVGGVIVGDALALALIDGDGDETFYHRKPGGSNKSFSLRDVRTHRIDETRGAELADTLSGQFQKGEFLYSFEFKEDGRTGFIHEWRSEPFTITGHEFSSPLFRQNVESIYSVEDLLIFDDVLVLKRDASESRLRPKSDAEAAEDMKEMEDRIADSGGTQLIVQFTDGNGNVYRYPLPFSSMGDLSQISIVVQ